MLLLLCFLFLLLSICPKRNRFCGHFIGVQREMVGFKFVIKARMNEWVSTLLECEFFTSCVDHQSERKNEKNLFCIGCCLSLCRHCMDNHGHHRCLQICKYVYRDVIRLQDLKKHLDCSGIQTYIINGKKAVHITPRPNLSPRPLPSKDNKLTDSDHSSELHQKDERQSSKSRSGGACEGCGRYLQDMTNRFCSIACKVSAVPVNQCHDFFTAPVSDVDNLSLKNSPSPYSESNKTESSISMADSSAEVKPCVNSSEHLKPKKHLNKRKGIPRRSPSF